MADDSTNQLLDLIGELLIENRAYRFSIKALEKLLPVEKQKVDEVIAAAKAHPDLQAEIRRLIALLKGRSSEEAIQHLTSLVRRG